MPARASSKSKTKQAEPRTYHENAFFISGLPTASFNAAVKDVGRWAHKLDGILKAVKPKAIYFTDHDGQRGAVAVIEVTDVSKIPALCEPWFLTFEAKVETRIAMSPEDLKKSGLDSLGKIWGDIPHGRGVPSFFWSRGWPTRRGRRRLRRGCGGGGPCRGRD